MHYIFIIYVSCVSTHMGCLAFIYVTYRFTIFTCMHILLAKIYVAYMCIVTYKSTYM